MLSRVVSFFRDLRAVVNETSRMFDTFYRHGQIVPDDLRAHCIPVDVAIEQMRSRLSEGRGYVIELNPEAIKRNQEIFVPVALAAVNGDKKAIEFYEKGRLLHWDALPSWLKEDAAGVIKVHHSQALKVINGEVGRVCPHLSVVYEEKDSERNDLINVLGLRAVSTHEKLTDLLERTTPSAKREVLCPQAKRDLELRKRGDLEQAGAAPRALSLWFSPVTGFEQGAEAHRALRKVLPRLLSGALIEDLLIALDIPASDEQKQKLLRQLKGPTVSVENRRVATLFELSAAFEFLEPSPGERQSLTQRHFSGNNIASLYPIEESDSRESIVEPGPGTEEHNPEILKGLIAALPGRDGLSKEERESLKRLARLVKKGLTDYASTVQALGRGASPEMIAQEIYESFAADKKRAGSERSSAGEIDLRAEKIAREPAADQTRPEVLYYGGGRSQVLSFMADLRRDRPHHFAPLEEKINALCSGRCDAKHIKAVKGEKVFELRHSDLRVYFRRAPEGAVELILAGKKGEQKGDIEILQRIFP